MPNRNATSGLILLIVLILARPVQAQQTNKLPTDGNDLLDYCSVLVDLADSTNSFSSLSEKRLLEQMGKFNWCAGYIQATMEHLSATHLNLALIAMSGVTFSGPDAVKLYALDSLRVACIPENAPVLQVARVIVKWLREHPERLHEPKSILLRDALKEAFPCAAPTPPKEAVGPNTVKP